VRKLILFGGEGDWTISQRGRAMNFHFVQLELPSQLPEIRAVHQSLSLQLQQTLAREFNRPALSDCAFLLVEGSPSFETPTISRLPSPQTLHSPITTEADNMNVSSIQNESEQLEYEVVFAHRIVISAASEYFRTLWNWSDRNGQQSLPFVGNKLCIPLQAPVQAFKTLLEYVYTENEDLINEEDVVSLLELSDMFGVLPLRDRCEVFLASAITPENAGDLLEVAQQTGCLQLQRLCESVLHLPPQQQQQLELQVVPVNTTEGSSSS
jgi:hypothetical protein